MLSVVGLHVFGGPLGSPWFGGGSYGVDLFFVLSGFLIGSLLIEEFDRTSRISFRGFYRRRAYRLLPALWLLLAVDILLSRVIFVFRVAVPFHNVLTGAGLAFGYIMNWGYVFGWTRGLALDHTWSLGIEEEFYLFFPLFLSLLLRLRSRWLGISILASCAVLSAASRGFVYSHVQSNGLVFPDTPLCLDGLLLGAAVALALHRGWNPGRWVNALALPLFGGFVWLVVRVTPFAEDAWDPYGMYFAVAVAGCIMVLSAIKPGSLLNRILSIPVLTFLGRISYSIYLWHFVVLAVVPNMFPRWQHWLWAVVSLAVTLGISVASYYLMERPLIARAHRPAISVAPSSSGELALSELVVGTANSLDG